MNITSYLDRSTGLRHMQIRNTQADRMNNMLCGVARSDDFRRDGQLPLGDDRDCDVCVDILADMLDQSETAQDERDMV